MSHHVARTTSPRYFVRRTRIANWEDVSTEALLASGQPWKCAGYVSWTGPLGLKRANEEADAWERVGWTSEVLPSTPEVLAEVRAFERQKKVEGR
jgi:hypothetical protein